MVPVTGTIRERSPGHFEFRAFNAATGKQVTRTYVHPGGEPGVGIRAARAALARLVTDVANGKYGGEKATLGHLLDEWIRFSEEARGRSPNTIAGYRTKAKRIQASTLANKMVTKLTAKDLDEFYLRLKSDGLSPSSVHHFHRILRAALNQAVKWGWTDVNVRARQPRRPLQCRKCTSRAWNRPALCWSGQRGQRRLISDPSFCSRC